MVNRLNTKSINHSNNLLIWIIKVFKVYDTIRNRIKFILDIAEKNNETELILGAF